GVATGRRAGAAMTALTRLHHVPGGRLRTALLLRTAEGLQSVEATLAIDPTRLRLAKARAALAARDALLLAHEPTPGPAAAALANRGEIAAGARVAITFEFERVGPSASRSAVQVTNITFDE